MLTSYTINYLAENAMSIEFPAVVDREINQQVAYFHELINARPFDGFIASVPAYSTLTVFYDPVRVWKTEQLIGTGCCEKVSAYLQHLFADTANEIVQKKRRIEIPTCYGGGFGPDLQEVSKLLHLHEEDIIAIHSNAVYSVYMIGFVPGFAYLGGLSEQLNVPRKPVPRKKVPAGSVGLAGAQTGIYPFEIPGGWQLIGRTPLSLFKADRTAPALLKAGDEVVFKRISENEFEYLRSMAHAD